MTKARFAKEQEAVLITYYNGKIYVYISLNGEKKTEARIDYDDSVTTDTYWEYDYNEFSFSGDEINIEDIKTNPKKYLNYPVDEPTETEQMRADIDYLLMVMEG